MEASQYGILQRCIELVEQENVSVVNGDEEGITVLHWAAINNRIPVASYFIQKGADVNAIGGELQGTPLHWATRQGHLPMVVLLMRYRANPYLKDAEGLNCLHVAIQFQLYEITAYYISRGMVIDEVDKDGKTPLMWAALRVFNVDMTRLLVNMGASLSVVDIDNNTALHHAAQANNILSMKVLIESGAQLHSVNKDDKTPYMLAVENQNKYGISLLSEKQKKNSPKNLWEYVTKNPRINWWVCFWTPTVFLPLFGLCGVYSSSPLQYFISMTVVGAVLQLIIRVYVSVHSVLQANPLPVGLVLATKLWIYVTTAGWLIPTGIIQRGWLVYVLLVIMGLCLYKTMKGDPGYVPLHPDLTTAKKRIVELCELGQFTQSTFCSTCLIRRPIRSKHCPACNRCVAKYDHHCPWTYNCIGYQNHKAFLAYLLSLLFLLNWGVLASLRYVYKFCPPPEGNFMMRGIGYMRCQPWVMFIFINCAVHSLWVYLLFVSQIVQLFLQGSTTNEKINAFRYAHFSKLGGLSPFNRGVCANCADFFGITCCGANPEDVDWTKTFDVPKKDTTEEPKLPEPTIPLPHYSTATNAAVNPSSSDNASKNTTYEPYVPAKVHTI